MTILNLVKLDIFFSAGYYWIGYYVVELDEVGFEIRQLSRHDLYLLQFDHVLKLVDNYHIAHLMIFARQAEELLVIRDADWVDRFERWLEEE